MGVDSAEHVVTIAAAVIVVRCTILGIGVFPTWIVHEIALADVDASGVEAAQSFGGKRREYGGAGGRHSTTLDKLGPRRCRKT